MDFAAKNPHAAVTTEIKRNLHPYVKGEYVRGEPKVIDVKNLSSDEVGEFVMRLRNSSGRKMTRLNIPVSSDRPSIQGVWTPNVPFQRMEFELDHHYADDVAAES